MAGLAPWPGKSVGKEDAWLLSVSQVPILRGYLVDVVFAASDQATARHSLGRPYVGGIVVAVPSPTATPVIYVQTPSNASRAGADIKNYFVVGAASSFTGIVQVWLF